MSFLFRKPEVLPECLRKKERPHGVRRTNKRFLLSTIHGADAHNLELLRKENKELERANQKLRHDSQRHSDSTEGERAKRNKEMKRRNEEIRKQNTLNKLEFFAKKAVDAGVVSAAVVHNSEEREKNNHTEPHKRKRPWRKPNTTDITAIDAEECGTPKRKRHRRKIRIRRKKVQ
eukprot:TRINITY_DN930_c1_g1_i1.p1 TRINITY_DN930_c1_g1~~TRINITY_DN930_c1_g1_i1.p1  ORF type:complete len:175 (-),score=18.35 TRINITY_DN930_c1_g1_i1:98-622(-)